LNNSLYTNEIRQHFNTADLPLGLRWRIVELFEPDCLKIRLYRQNINALDSDDKLKTATVLGETLRKINDSGVPMYTWVLPGDGKHDCFGQAECELGEECPYV
jgi:hypothetical protein